MCVVKASSLFFKNNVTVSPLLNHSKNDISRFLGAFDGFAGITNNGIKYDK